MKPFALPLAAGALLLAFSSLSPVAARDEATASRATEQRNYRITRDHFAELLKGPAPQAAQLNLLMTMLPKGGDLHHHYSGAIYVEDYLDLVDEAGYCIYTVTDPAQKAERFRVETRYAQAAEQPKNCLKAEAVRRDVAFYRELLKTWSDKDFDNHFHEQLAPDQHFFNTFGYFGGLPNYRTNKSLGLLKTRAKAENLQYLETMLKSAPSQVPRTEAAAQLDALPADAGEAQVQAALAALHDAVLADENARRSVDDYVKMLEQDAAGLSDADFTLRFQTYVTRNNAPSRVFTGLVNAFQAAQKTPLLVGVNIVGPENGHVAIRDYALHMRMFGFLKQRYPSVRLALHAGELTLGMVPPEHLRGHIRQALDAGAERIGHGIDITWESQADELLARMREKKIAVEVNLTSNAFILGIKGEMHPLTVYRRHGVPIVISTDDAGVSRNDLSGEYLLFVTRYKPTYAELKDIVANSIRHAFLTEQEKAAELKKLEARFKAFEARVARMKRQFSH